MMSILSHFTDFFDRCRPLIGWEVSGHFRHYHFLYCFQIGIVNSSRITSDFISIPSGFSDFPRAEIWLVKRFLVILQWSSGIFCVHFALPLWGNGLITPCLVVLFLAYVKMIQFHWSTCVRQHQSLSNSDSWQVVNSQWKNWGYINIRGNILHVQWNLWQ